MISFINKLLRRDLRVDARFGGMTCEELLYMGSRFFKKYLQNHEQGETKFLEKN